MRNHPKRLVQGRLPYYTTELGAAYLGDALQLVKKVRRQSIPLIMTSPPFALTTQKNYGPKFDGIDADSYVDWFMTFAIDMYDALTKDGSLVVHLGGTWVPGRPIKSLYHYKLALELCERTKFRLAQDFYVVNKAKLPTPAQWVAVQRIRVKDSVDPVWWFCKDGDGSTRADNRRVLQPYSNSMKDLLKRGSYNNGPRPSGQHISAKSFLKRHRGSIPPNLITLAGTDSKSTYLRQCRTFGVEVNPARYPISLPDFFIRLLTRKGDTVLDPFAGSNTTGEAAERLGRRWLAFETYEPYLKGSGFRFFTPERLGFKLQQTSPPLLARQK